MRLSDGKEFVPAEGVVLIPIEFVAPDDVIAYLDVPELRQGRVKRLRWGYEDPPLEGLPGLAFFAAEFCDEREKQFSTDKQVRWLGRWQ